MRVLIVAPNFGVFGGCEAFVFALAEELFSAGVDVTIGFKRVSGRFAMDDTLQSYVDASPAPVVFVNRASGELVSLIRNADLIHAQNTSIDIALIATFFRKPLVLTIHGWLRDKWSPRSVLARLTSWLADRRWYNSGFVWSKWEPGAKRKTSGRLPIVSNLPNGVVEPELRKGFVFAARWIENKGLEVLVEAYAGSSLDKSAWPLTLMGDGPLRTKVMRLIEEVGGEGIRITGFVDNETRNETIRRSKWMVTPPHTNEDLGLTPIEARHVGVPSIITRDGGLPEAGGRFALQCEPADVAGLRRCLEQAAQMPEEEYKRISEETRKELLEYLQPMSLYLEAYQDVLAQR